MNKASAIRTKVRLSWKRIINSHSQGILGIGNLLGNYNFESKKLWDVTQTINMISKYICKPFLTINSWKPILSCRMCNFPVYKLNYKKILIPVPCYFVSYVRYSNIKYILVKLVLKFHSQ